MSKQKIIKSSKQTCVFLSKSLSNEIKTLVYVQEKSYRTKNISKILMSFGWMKFLHLLRHNAYNVGNGDEEYLMKSRDKQSWRIVLVS